MPDTPIQARDERVMPFSIDQVWSVLADAKEYPNWYPSSVTVRVLVESATLVGTTFEIRPQGGRGFTCEVTDAEAPRRMGMRYPGDFIVGTGEWRLEPLESGGSRVIYAIDAVANGWLAAVLGRILSFANLHSKAMQEILAALEQETARRNSRSGQ